MPKDSRREYQNVLGSFPHTASTIYLTFSKELCLQFPSSLLTLSSPSFTSSSSHTSPITSLHSHASPATSSPSHTSPSFLTLSKHPPSLCPALMPPFPHILTFSHFPIHLLILSCFPHHILTFSHFPFYFPILSRFPYHLLAFPHSPRNFLTLSHFPPTSSHSQKIPPHFVLLSCPPLPHIRTFSHFPFHFFILSYFPLHLLMLLAQFPTHLPTTLQIFIGLSAETKKLPVDKECSCQLISRKQSQSSS